ncbi:somatostatin receptor type 2-like [Glandiceps talaboti]
MQSMQLLSTTSDGMDEHDVVNTVAEQHYNATEIQGIGDAFFFKIIPALYSCICVIGLIGNFLVIYVLIRHSSKRSIPNVFILNLAIADFLFMCTLPFQAHSLAKKEWIFGNAMCKLITGFDGMNQFTGIFILTAMSVDRHLAIVYPIKFRAFRTINKARLVNVSIWCASLLASLPLWLFSQEYTVSNSTNICTIIWPDYEGDTVFILFTFNLGFTFPLLVIAVCYIKAFTHLCQVHRPDHRLRAAKIRQESRRVAVMVIVIVIAFVVCWLPFYVLNITLSLDYHSPSMLVVSIYSISICLSYSNSCLNPIIYSFMGTNFRNNMAKSKLFRILGKHLRLQHESRNSINSTCSTRFSTTGVSITRILPGRVDSSDFQFQNDQKCEEETTSRH